MTAREDPRLVLAMRQARLRASRRLSKRRGSASIMCSVGPPVAAAATRVTVADDVCDSADTVAQLLAAQGIEARAVYDGHQALALAESWRPDGAILDLGLPGLTG